MDVQIHIEKAANIINANLPTQYASKVLKKLPKEPRFKSQLVRDVRLKLLDEKAKPNINLENYLDVVAALVTVAKENLASKEALIKSLS